MPELRYTALRDGARGLNVVHSASGGLEAPAPRGRAGDGDTQQTFQRMDLL